MNKEDQLTKINEAIEENALYSRDRLLEAIQIYNASSDKLSSELGVITGVIFGFLGIFLKDFTPVGIEQKLILITLVLFLVLSAILAIVNKYLIYKFWEEQIPNAKDRAKAWMVGRNKSSKKDVDLIAIYNNILKDEESSLKDIKIKSPEWPLNMQMITLAIAVIFIIVYLFIKVV